MSWPVSRALLGYLKLLFQGGELLPERPEQLDEAPFDLIEPDLVALSESIELAFEPGEVSTEFEGRPVIL